MRKIFLFLVLAVIGLFITNLSFAEYKRNPDTGFRDYYERGVPSGGTTDQILTKNSNADYDLKWSTVGATSGDITSVGDCTTGACFDGTSDGGTYFDFYDGIGAAKRFSFDATKYDFRLLDDLDLEDANPHLNFRDTTDNTAYMWHLETHTSAAPYQNFQLWRGTDDGTGFSVNPDIPLVWFDNNNITHLGYGLTLATGKNLILGTTQWNSGDSIDGQKIVSLIDDTKGNGDTGYVWSADKVFDQFALKGAIAGQVWTGVHDFGGATSVEIPNAAAPTVDVTGEVAIDTTDDQFIYYGAAKRVIPYQNCKCAVVENLAAADDNMSLGMFDKAVTITGVACSYRGTGTTPATITLKDGSGNAMTITGTNPTCVPHGTNATFAAVTAGNGLVAGEIVRFDVTNAVSPETDEYTICLQSTTDAQ